LFKRTSGHHWEDGTWLTENLEKTVLGQLGEAKAAAQTQPHLAAAPCDLESRRPKAKTPTDTSIKKIYR
jgi:hypothetical protein